MTEPTFVYVVAATTSGSYGEPDTTRLLGVYDNEPQARERESETDGTYDYLFVIPMEMNVPTVEVCY